MSVSASSQEARLRAAILVVCAYVFQGAQDVAGRWRRLGQMSADHMEAQLVGYVARLDGHTLRRGIAKYANRFQCAARGLHIDAIAGPKGELEDALLVQRRDAIIRNLCIPFTLVTHQSTNASDSHQSPVQLAAKQRQAQTGDQLYSKQETRNEHFSNIFRFGSRKAQGRGAYKISHICREHQKHF